MTIGPAASLTALDLFCGCGGFTLGLQRVGFSALAAVDFDFNAEAIATLSANLVEKRHPGLMPVANAIEADLTQFPPERLAALLRDSLASTGQEGRGEEGFRAWTSSSAGRPARASAPPASATAQTTVTAASSMTRVGCSTANSSASWPFPAPVCS